MIYLCVIKHWPLIELCKHCITLEYVSEARFSFTLLTNYCCNSNPPQYERNRRFRHLVHAPGWKAIGAKLPSQGLWLNASKSESRLVFDDILALHTLGGNAMRYALIKLQKPVVCKKFVPALYDFRSPLERGHCPKRVLGPYGNCLCWFELL